MGIFKKKKIQSDGVFEQDLSQKDHPGAVFVMRLLMKESVSLPKKEWMTEIMSKRLDDVECFSYDEKIASFLAKKYLAQFKDASLPPQLMVTKCEKFDEASMDEFQRRQMWDCMEERDRILSECKYQVFATDMMAATLPAKERAEMVMDFMEALVELYPACEAVYFNNSGKMFSADQIRNHSIPREDRFIYFAVNARFFNIQGGDDMMVDTMGMNTLFLPDLQYHFHGMEPDWVVNHAYNIASYILKNDNPIENGDTIDGVSDGEIDIDVQWKCHYEKALIQPVREVIDIYMNEYASGGREYD